MPASRYLKEFDSIIAAVVGFWLIQVFTNYSGVGISPDSIMYTSAARSLHTDGSFTTFAGLPLVDFPFFYPLFLWVVMVVSGIDTIAAAPVLNGLLFGMVIFLSGWIIGRFSYTSRLYKILILAVIVLSPGLLQVYTYLWSETLYILLSLVFIIAYRYYISKHSWPALILIAFIAAVSTVTRYAGVTIIGTGGILLLFDRNLQLKKKAIHVICYGFIAISLLVANLIRNKILTKTVTGPREPSITSFGKNVEYFGSTMCEWLHLNEDMTLVLATPIAWVILLALTGMWITNVIVNRTNNYEHTALTYALIYGFFIIISATFSRYERINSRLLAPMFIPLVWSLTYRVIRAIQNIRINKIKRAWAWSGFAVVMLAFVINEGYADHVRHYEQSEYGNPGYTDDDWNRSRFVVFLKANKHIYKPGVPIYSDANEAAYFTAGIRCKLLPHRFFAKKVEAFYKVKHYYLIWFNALDNPELISIKDIEKKHKLKKLHEYPEGAIYEVFGE